MTDTTAKKPPAEEWAGDAAGWGRLAQHNITLPSGMRVTVRIPDVLTLLQNSELPTELRRAALQALTREDGVEGAVAEMAQQAENDPAAEERLFQLAREGYELRRYVAHRMLVKPEISYEQFCDDRIVPPNDRQLLAQLAYRETGYDARGVRLGVEPLDAWAGFRRHHECGADCSACEALQRELSSTHPDAL